MNRQNERLINMTSPVVTGLGFEFWGLEYLPRGDASLLRIYIDHENGVDVDDCKKVSQQLVGVLDVEDPIPGAYQLEVSSPGLDRLLFSAEQCQRYLGHEVMVRLGRKLEGRRRFSGKMSTVSEQQLELIENEEPVSLPMSSIESIRLKPEF